MRDAGHDVLFIERGVSRWRGSTVTPMLVEPGIWVARPTRSMHKLEGTHASAESVNAVDH
jgi:hypothetical protein